jgi:uncharacterized protein
MRPFYTYALVTILFTLNFGEPKAQIRANFIDYSNRPTAAQIEEYRNSIWEDVPQPDGWTNDYEGIFSAEEEITFTKIITGLEDKTGIEIALVTVDSNMISLEKFDDFADHLLNVWGVGKVEKDNGILICISSQHQRISISRGVGTDKFLTDAALRQIITKSFIPLYMKNNYFGGTLSGLTALVRRLQPAN